MLHKILKFKFIIIGTLIFVFIFLSSFFFLNRDGVDTSYALKMPDYNTLVDQGFEAMMLAHHKYMNTLFNDRIKLISSAKIPTGDCVNDDIRTYCLAEEGEEALQDYLDGLEKLRTKINKGIANVPYTFVTIAENLDEQGFEIDKEKKAAEESFLLALELYDQYQMNLGIHNAYQKVISNLEKYRDKLIKIRKPSDLLPSKFIGVTTDKCT
jgi:hypothetical protein